jgi:outer membrane receptor protein involved in Fe transport
VLPALAAVSILLAFRAARSAESGDSNPTAPGHRLQVAQVTTQPPTTEPPGTPSSTQAPGTEPPTTEPTAPTAPGQPSPGSQPPATQQPGATQGGAAAIGGGAGFSAPTGAAEAPRAGAAQAEPGAIQIAGGQSQPLAASDVGSLLGRSQESTGVELQRRTPIVSDPRIRGFHVGQVTTLADGGFFFPARQDLDTAVSKIDASNLRDVIVIKGPYSVLYGPGFAFIDIATFDTPRYENGFEVHGRTNFGWQSNGQRLNGFQSVWGGGADYGFRLSYDILVGNDYEAGNGQNVPASYNSQPFNYDFGYSFSPDNRIEFKGIHLEQRNVEFPALYFDIANLQTDAQSLRWTVQNQEFFNRFALDAWYNHTAASGTTAQGAKQLFLDTFLTNGAAPFVHPVPPPPGTPVIQDRSFSLFSQGSKGYRGAITWGDANDLCPQLTVGTDLNYLNQQLHEYIRYIQLVDNPFNVPTGAFPPGSPSSMTPVAYQNPQIPSAYLVDPGVFAELVLPIGKRVSLKAGVRGDFVETHSDDRTITGNIPVINGPAGAVTSFDPIIFSSNPNDPKLGREFDLWSAYLSGEFRIDQHLKVLAAFGHAERPPTPTELYAAGPYISVLQQGLDRLYGDPNLHPEKLNQVDFGLRANYDWFRAGASGFYSYINDYITFDANNLSGGATGSGATSGPNPIAQVVYTNTNDATLAGGEVFCDFDLTEYLTPFGSVSYVQGWDLTHIDTRRAPNLASSRRTIDQEPLPGITPLEGRAGIRLHEPTRSPRWSIELGARMVDEQNLVATSLGEVPTPGFTIWDLRSYWQVSQALLLTAGVENFTDKFYREHLDPRSGFPGDQLFRPGTNFYMGVSVQY